MQKLFIPIQFKAADDAEGIFTGIANATGVTDLAGERVMPGAFRADLAKNGARRPLQWQHDCAEPIGVVDLAETALGLQVTRGQLALGVQRGKEAYELLKVPGAIGGMSIGYIVTADRLAMDGVRELLEVTVFEVSLVTHPANPASIVQSVKDRRDADLAQRLESLYLTVHSATRELKAGRVLSAANEQALRDAVDAISRVLQQVDASTRTDAVERAANRVISTLRSLARTA